ncbi:Gfo/Idh/MocA family protein [Actinomyces gaoshouyii]|uniref:Gfo/Idh/MocA family protein n=1 Tax=Actinomyces gaoshouyii TaxID=1960083 RepID=UPI0009C16833|nr:Gfo/Idh/MocA family oxidoreductase [Actinomyces gaoshouyii]ARD42087.1 inositol 2-dehydrogenase [Actinomyces gaoshouyii]
MTVRIGLIGAGGMGRAHLARIQDDLSGGEIVAVADINPDAARSAAEPYGAKAYVSSDELINDPDVDAVLIATFGKVHAPDVIKAIEAGKYVLCEKPLATTAEDCIAIMDAEQRAGKRLVTVGFMRRFDAAYNEMKEVLDSGEHGQVLMVHNRHRNPSVPENYTSRMAIDDTAIHEFDTMRWLLGEEIVKVRVDRPKPTTHRFDHLIDPIVVVAYTESGVRIDDEVNVNLQWAYSIECELVLETAAVRLGDQERIHIRDSHGNRNAMCQSHIDRFQAAFNREVQEWINAVAEDRHTGSTAWDGYAATCVVDAAVKSHEDGGSPLVDVELIDKPGFYA